MVQPGVWSRGGKKRTMGGALKLERRTSRPSPSLRTKSGAAAPGLSIGRQDPPCVKKLTMQAQGQGPAARGPLQEGDLELLLDDAVDGVHEVDLEDGAGGPVVVAAHPVEE